MRKLLDGKKRALLLLAYMISTLIQTTGTGYEGPAGAARQALDWNADGRLPLPASVILGTTLGSIAIYCAVVKSMRARAERADIVSTRGYY